MQNNNQFSYLFTLLLSLFKLFVTLLALMSLARVYLFSSHEHISYALKELFDAFFLGMRLDASVLAYAFFIPVLVVFIVWLFKLTKADKWLYKLFRIYFFFIVTVLFAVTASDYAYFSFFGTHSTLMIFGVFDDDTTALIKTAFNNYNIPVVAVVSLLILSFLYYLVYKIVRPSKVYTLHTSRSKEALFFFVVIALMGLLGRGSIGVFPIMHNVEDVSADAFLNKMPQTPTYAMLNSYKHYKKSKSGHYDLIKMAGYKGKIEQAFKDFKQSDKIDTKNLLKNITYTTPKNKMLEKKKPNVVVVMVESFGAPVLDYESKTFDIMGRLKKHFDEDTVYNRFISASNGTIVSLEPVLLNITARPNSTSFGQSKYMNTAFKQASARVYQEKGYETSFVYGGDLSWRNVGGFLPKQGFDHVEGKAAIAAALGKNAEDISHTWGVFDEYLYKYIELKLKNAKKPQFIYVLTTNNHPPYTIPKDYKSKPLVFSKRFKEHLTGDMDLANLRFHDYAYALDSLGGFLDNIKKSDLAKNTVVAVTADNNTVEGIMRYDNYYTQTKRIPFYLYLPDYIKPKKAIDVSVPGSHKDIFPTLYNLTLSHAKYTAVGTNLRNPNTLHCGFNDAGIIMSKDGGFLKGTATGKAEKECQKYYNAALAVTEYLIKTNAQSSVAKGN